MQDRKPSELSGVIIHHTMKVRESGCVSNSNVLEIADIENQLIQHINKY